MREILFRGKSNWAYGNVKQGDWLYSMTISPHCYTDEKITSYYIGGGNNTIDATTLGQYTGSTDKNGKKIFEGDIVKVDFEMEYGGLKTKPSYVGVVKYDGGAFGIYEKGKGTQFFFQHGLIKTVIGNIHDNPELLKRKE